MRPSAVPALFLTAGTFLVFRHLGGLIPSWTGPTPDGLRLAFVLSQALGLGGPCLLAALLWRQAPWGLLPPPPAALLQALVLVLGLWVPLWALDSLRAQVVGDPGKEAVIRILLTPGIGGTAMLLVVFGAVPALFEEGLFRGLLQPALTASWGAAPAILVSSALFAAFHMSPAQTAVQLVLGLALGWMRHRTGSLWPCVLGHALHNGLAVALMLKFPGAFGEEPSMPPLGAVAGGLALAVLSARALRRGTAGR